MLTENHPPDTGSALICGTCREPLTVSRSWATGQSLYRSADGGPHPCVSGPVAVIRLVDGMAEVQPEPGATALVDRVLGSRRTGPASAAPSVARRLIAADIGVVVLRDPTGIDAALVTLSGAGIGYASIDERLRAGAR